MKAVRQLENRVGLTTTLIEMNLGQFKRSARALPAEEASIIRNRFIKSFVDTRSKFFQKRVRCKRRFSDGLCYEGYLWDCLKNPRRIPIRAVLRRLLQTKQVFVLWDIHSSDRIWVRDYWLFPKSSVLEVPPEVLVTNVAFLPEDVYFFDKSYHWSLILTHEDIRGVRLCIAAKP